MNPDNTDTHDDAELEGGAGVAADSEGKVTEGQQGADAEGNEEFDSLLDGAQSPEELAELVGKLSEPSAKSDTGEDASSDESGQEQDGQEDQESDGEQESGGEEDDDDGESGDQESEDEESGEDEAAGQEKEQPSESERARNFRLKAKDELDAEFYAIRKRNPDMGLEDALVMAKRKLGLDQEKSGQQGVNGDQQEDNSQEDGDVAGLNEEISTMEAELDAIWNEFEQAQEDLDEDKVKSLPRQAAKKEAEIARKRAEAEFKAERAKEEASARLERESVQYADQAVNLYPFVEDDNHPASARLDEVNRLLRESNSPLVNRPDYPLRLAERVADEFGILPKGEKSPARKKPEAVNGSDPKVSKAKATQKTPVQSGKRKSDSNQSRQGDLDSKIDALQTPDDLDEFLEKELQVSRF